MATPQPNIVALNDTIAFLSNTIADTEEKLKKEKTKNDNLTKECNLLSNEIQTKAIEITKLKNENDNLIKENNDLKEQIEKDKKEIEEFKAFKKIHEKQNYTELLEQKKKLDEEKKEIIEAGTCIWES